MGICQSTQGAVRVSTAVPTTRPQPSDNAASLPGNAAHAPFEGDARSRIGGPGQPAALRRAPARRAAATASTDQPPATALNANAPTTRAARPGSPERVSSEVAAARIPADRSFNVENLQATLFSAEGGRLQRILEEVQNTPTSLQTHAYNVGGEQGGATISKAANSLMHLVRNINANNAQGGGTMELQTADEMYAWLQNRMQALGFDHEAFAEVQTNTLAAPEAMIDCCNYVSARSDAVTKDFINELRSIIGCDTGRDNQVYFALLSIDSQHLLGSEKSFDIIPSQDTKAHDTLLSKLAQTYNALLQQGQLEDNSSYQDVYSALKNEVVGAGSKPDLSFTTEAFDALFPILALRVEVDGIPNDAVTAIRLGQNDLAALEGQQHFSRAVLKQAVDSMPLVECLMHFDAEHLLQLKAEAGGDDAHPAKTEKNKDVDSYSLSTAARSLIYGSEKSTTAQSNLHNLIKHLPSALFTTKSGLGPLDKSLLESIDNSNIFDPAARSGILIELVRHHPAVARSLSSQNLLQILNSAAANGAKDIGQLVENGLGSSIFIDRELPAKLHGEHLANIRNHLTPQLCKTDLLHFIHDSDLSAKDPRVNDLFKLLSQHPGAIRSMDTERVLKILNLAVVTGQQNIEALVDGAFKNTLHSNEYFLEMLADDNLSKIKDLLLPIIAHKTEGNIIKF